MGKAPSATREGQSLHHARIQRLRCTSKKPCGGYYYADAETGQRIERVPDEPASPFDESHDPLASISLSDTTYDEANTRAFSEPFYALLGETMPRSEILPYLPYLAEGARRLQLDDPLYHALLVERYTHKRSVRALCTRYVLHHDMLDRALQRALATLHDYVADAKHMAETQAC